MRFFTGVVEDRMDPMKLGRCRVRVVGIHTHNKTVLPTEDLPWSMPVQPMVSGAMSGIGKSPVGPVEGTWVVVFFQDEDNQFPMMMGTIGGIPQQEGTVDEDTGSLVINLDNNLQGDSVIFDSDGNPQYQGDLNPLPGEVPDPTESAEEQTVPENIPTAGFAKPGGQYTTISQRAVNELKRHEGLAKKIGNGQIQAYPDPATGAEPWTIGYGTTRINGRAVTPRTIITEAEAERLFVAQVKSTYLPAVTSRVRAVVTQSMIDAMTSLVYNIGAGNFAKSSVLRETNAGNYEKAARAFLLWNKAAGRVLSGLTKRRRDEMQLYLSDGIPGTGNQVDPSTIPPEQPRPPEVQEPTVPVGDPTPSGAPSTGRTNTDGEMGFKDPNEVYPRYINEPDTNRLARHDFIEKTIVYNKEAARLTEVETAQGKTWDQPEIPYNAEYPFNHVWESESGHIQEFDDTPDSERYHLYHRTGTFQEIDHNGTQVNRIIGNNYIISERNGYVYIAGTCDVTVDGATNLLVKNTMNIDIWQNANIRVFNNADIQVGGFASMVVTEDLDVKAKNIHMEAEEEFSIKTGKGMQITVGETLDTIVKGRYNIAVDQSYQLYSGSSISIHAAANTNVKAGGSAYYNSANSMDILAGGRLRVDYSRGNFGEGASGAPSVSPTGNEAIQATTLENLAPGDVEVVEPEDTTLSVNTRQEKEAVEYDTEEEQAAEQRQYSATTLGQNNPVRSGAVIPSDQFQADLPLDQIRNDALEFPTPETIIPKENIKELVDKSSDFIKNLGSISAVTAISNKFNLGDFTKKGARPLKDNPAANVEKGDIANNLKNLTTNSLDPIKQEYPSMKILSGYRQPKNATDVSQNTTGEAVDIKIEGLDRRGHWEAIQWIQQNVPYDQLILEYDSKTYVWIHISLKKTGNRKEHYTMFHNKRKGNMGEFIYIPEAE